jgi:hypothetical protein
VYQSQGKYDESLDLYQKTEKVYIVFYGYEHPLVVTTVRNIDDVYDDQGKYDETVELYIKVEKVFVAVYGYAHPDVDTSMISELCEHEGLAFSV